MQPGLGDGDLTVLRGSAAVPGARPAGLLRRLAGLLRAYRLRLGAAQLLMLALPVGPAGRPRSLLYRLAGFRHVDRDAVIRGRLELRGAGQIAARLRVGRGSTLNVPCFIDLSGPVAIGERVAVGHHVVIVTSSHEVGPAQERCGRHRVEPVAIGDGAWVGASVTLLPGVTVGPGAVVTAGSVVTKSVPANAKVAGSPARVIGWLEPASGTSPAAGPDEAAG